MTSECCVFSRQLQPCIPLEVIDGLVRCVHPGIGNHVSFDTVLNAIKEYGCDLPVLGNRGNLIPGVGTRCRVSLPSSPRS